jgi:putative aminopeptidase FrvX
MILKKVRKLAENNIVLPYKLYIVNSVQEEEQLRGAEMIAKLSNQTLPLLQMFVMKLQHSYTPSKEGEK